MKGVIITIALLLPFFFSSAHETEQAVVIAITEQGFDPHSISVETHTKVLFINRGSEGHWPASDRHPSHTDYSGTDLETHCGDMYQGEPVFDACTPIAPGDTWSFIFEKTGTFHYHDHVWSHLGGTITVTEPAQTKLRIQVWLEKLFQWFKTLFRQQTKSLEEALSAAVYESNPHTAIALLQSHTARNKEIAAICHDLLHDIGRAAFEKYGSFEAAIVYQNDFCNSGYIHGVFEAYFSSTPAETVDVASLCQNLPSQRPFDEWQCYHGIGHGLMYQTGGNLNTSLSQCLSNLDSVTAPYCINGVYMELFNNEVLLHEPTYIVDDNPFQTCAAMTENQSDCYLYAPTYFSQNLDWSFDKIFDYCLILQDTNIDMCINGTASEFAKRNQSNMKQVFQSCDRFTNNSLRLACISGASSISVFQTASLETALSLCRNAGRYQDHCQNVVESYRPMFVETY